MLQTQGSFLLENGVLDVPSKSPVLQFPIGCVDGRLAARVGSTNKDAEHHRAPEKAAECIGFGRICTVYFTILVAHHRSIESSPHPRMVQEWLGSRCPITTGCLKSMRHWRGPRKGTPWSIRGWQDADEVTIKKAYRTLVSWGQGRSGWDKQQEMSGEMQGCSYSHFPPFFNNKFNHIQPNHTIPNHWQVCQHHLGFWPVISTNPYDICTGEANDTPPA